jgi:hypothetical protein
MIIYNVTTKVGWAVNDPWLRWMRDEYIPLMLNTGCFFESQILRLLEVDEDEGPTYAIQYFAHTTSDYRKYIQQYAARLRQQSHDKWGEQIVAFRSVMEVLH